MSEKLDTTAPLPSAAKQLDNLRAALVADVLAMTDEEIAAEAAEDGVDLEAEAEHMLAIFRAAAEKARNG